MERYIALVAIVKEGSFTKASEKLGYTQSALSQMIASLEKELGLTLLLRSHSGAKLSPDGKSIFPLIAQMVKNHDAVLEKSREINGLESSVITISCFSSSAVNLIPNLVSGFKNLYPNIEFLIDIADDEYNLHSVNAGYCNFAFTASNNNPNNKYILLGEEETKAILPKGHPLENLDVVPLEDLLKEPFLYNSFSRHEDNRQLGLQTYGFEPNITLSMENNIAIMDMVERGMGVSLVPNMSLSKNQYNIVIKTTEPSIKRNIYLAYKSKRSMPIASVRFMEYIVKEFPSLI